MTSQSTGASPKDRSQLVLGLLFLSVLAGYTALAPGTTVGVGYVPEDMRSGDSILANLHARISGQPVPPIVWTRHGPLSPILDLPFLLLGKALGSEDLTLSLEPVLDTAILITVVFAWLRKLTSPMLAFVLALAGAFGTMLWPYAYIGLETKQALFLMLAGYLALACGPSRTLPKALLLSLCGGIAVSVKSTGIVLLPAIAYLVWVQFRAEWRQRLPLVLTILVVVGTTLVWSADLKAQYWQSLGGSSWMTVRGLLADSVFQFLGNLIGVFGSPTKGLLLYAPAVGLSIYAVTPAWRKHRDVAAFVILSVGGTVFGFSLLRFFADEVWGPRYLHVCVAPLLLLFGASRERFSLRRDIVLIPLVAVGVVISFLGAFYYYGQLHFATMRAGQNAEEVLVGDPRWNHIWFNARLFTIWWTQPPNPVLWTPGHLWMYEAPKGALPDQAVNLKDYAAPQSFLVRNWGLARSGYVAEFWDLFLLSAFAFPLLLIGACMAVSGVALNPEVAKLLRSRQVLIPSAVLSLLILSGALWWKFKPFEGPNIKFRVTLAEKPNAVVEPILQLGNAPAAADLLAVKYVSADHLSLFFDHWGGPACEAPPQPLRRGQSHLIEFRIIDSRHTAILIDGSQQLSCGGLYNQDLNTRILGKNTLGFTTSAETLSGTVEFISARQPGPKR